MGTRPKLTVMALVAVCVLPPPAPVTSRENAPVATPLDAVTVSVAAPDGVTVVGEKLAVTPVGSGPVLSVTGNRNPSTEVSVTTKLAVLSGAKLCDGGATSRMKSGPLGV